MSATGNHGRAGSQPALTTDIVPRVRIALEGVCVRGCLAGNAISGDPKRRKMPGNPQVLSAVQAGLAGCGA